MQLLYKVLFSDKTYYTAILISIIGKHSYNYLIRFVRLLVEYHHKSYFLCHFTHNHTTKLAKQNLNYPKIFGHTGIYLFLLMQIYNLVEEFAEKYLLSFNLKFTACPLHLQGQK